MGIGIQRDQTILAKISQNTDIALAAGVVGIILVMIIPLPTIILDIFLSFNITIALVILLISLYALKPLDFSIFPSLLLVSTLARLSLNVASSRLILLRGNEGELAAGHVIKSFGKFVVGGNYVVGFVIFLILIVIQFVVITKGAGRIAEVAARFTLDAMPGKQMSIDADLNAGLISEDEARERRKMIAREADFYGAMDGASKFVRGDAIAGIIIVVIDIIGGFILGVVSHKMNLTQAARVYALLTIGDGLVTQIPALMISTASGIIVSRAASESNFGKEFALQLIAQPKAFAIASGMLLFMGLLPGLPKIPFLFLACISGIVAYVNRHGPVLGRDQIEEMPESDQSEPKERTDTLDINQIVEIDPMELEICHNLIPLVEPSENGKLLDRIKIIRRQCALELGFVVPPIRIRDNIQLKSGEYDMLIRGTRVTKGKVILGQYLAMNPRILNAVEEQDDFRIEGIETQEPVFGLKAYWIDEAQKDKAEIAGYTVVEPETVIATHITETIKTYAHELFGRQELKNILDNLKSTNQAIVEEFQSSNLGMGIAHRVIRNLLKEQVSIRDMTKILEVLVDIGQEVRDSDVLTEYVRHALSRNIVKPLISSDETLKVFTLEPSLEEMISNALITRSDSLPNANRVSLSLNINVIQAIINATALTINNISIETQPIILCSSIIRRHFKKLTEQYIPNLIVLSYNEIPSNIEVQQLGTVVLQLSDNNE
ncbi:flagellar biosynthesis protein FlhA [Candidatus Gottesmanbacteria bacterium]|nr:flagellar biosynthesis protein FlhA [Candidatus Gottesmanbacteria bacterium]